MGTYKLTVGVIDPLFEINNKYYSTYAPSMTGVKEETTATISLKDFNCENVQEGSSCFYDIDFNNQEDGSDLWIFRNVIDIGENWKNLEVILTSSFRGDVWYSKLPEENKLRISVIPSSGKNDLDEISYRLTARRFDHQKWTNMPDDVESGSALVVK